jgi:hypothetical protein
MTSMSLSASTPFTVHDLEGMPDDGATRTEPVNLDEAPSSGIY